MALEGQVAIRGIPHQAMMSDKLIPLIVLCKNTLGAENLVRQRIERLIGADGERFSLLELDELLAMIDTLVAHCTGEAALVARITSFRTEMIRLLEKTLDLNDPLEIASAMPRLSIDAELAARLHLVALHPDQRAGEEARLAPIHRLAPEIPAIVHRILAERPLVTREGAGNIDFENELVNRYLQGMSLQDADGLRRLLRNLSGKSEEMIGVFKRLSIAQVVSWSSSEESRIKAIEQDKATNFFFDWVFSDHQIGRGYAGYVVFPLKNIESLIDFIRQTLQKADPFGGFTGSILARIERFTSSKAFTTLHAIIERRGSDCSSLRVNGKGLTEEIHKTVTQTDSEAVRALRSAIRDFEYLLQWLRYYDENKEVTCETELSLRNHELSITNGRNAVLLRLAADPSTVVSHSVSFDKDSNTVVYVAPNGSGKSRALEMAPQVALDAQRGLVPVADGVNSPGIQKMDYVPVEGGKTTSKASAFQNWIRAVKRSLMRLQVMGSPGGIGLATFDEPGRGTDEIDAVPIIIALMAYLQKRGIYVGLSTHFADLHRYRDIMEELGITCDFQTIDRLTHAMRPGVERSYGIEEAERQGLDAEIIEMAKALLEFGIAEEIVLPKRSGTETLEQKDRLFTPLREADLVELGLFAHRETARTRKSYWQLGEQGRLYAFHSVLRDTERVPSAEREEGDEYDGILPVMSPVAAEVFHRLFTLPLTPEERLQRQKTVLALRDAPESGLADTAMMLRPFQGIEQLFCLEVWSGDSSYFPRFGRLKTTCLSKMGEQLKLVSECINTIPDLSVPLQSIKQELERVSKLELWTKFQTFWSCRNLRDPSDADWSAWAAFCHSHEEELREVVTVLGELNFYLTLAQTAAKENQCAVQYVDEEDIQIRGAKNSGLTARARALKSRKRGAWFSAFGQPEPNIRDEDIHEPVPIDMSIPGDCTATVLSGTNGAGKTQAMKTAAAEILRAYQTGFSNAESVTVPQELGFVAYSEAFSSEDQLSGSWANEVRMLQQIITAYQEAGQPGSGVIFLDEPGKGTSSEEAIPFLISFVKYFERRGVRVVFTTHFSSLYDYLDRLSDEDRIHYQALYMDYFSPEQEDRYRLREGRGSSEGIRMAEEQGLDPEIIQMADLIKRKISERKSMAA